MTHIESATRYRGLPIASLMVLDNELRVRFASGHSFALADDGQSCCESRYMSSDDDPAHYVGATFLGVEVVDAPGVEDGYEHHDCQFLNALTDRGTFQAVNHNEHNGYYGGFSVQITSESFEP